ncbi:tRNA dimethylallyltransferase [Sphingomonas sp. EC-HK361]|uniref:tRNA (adenosine(37)-N6)-dimethylallyltransferase MiaA n=1 Tax=Sphingomonas sp. EC-HK361 TaxID=2038397 RepID=UPI00125125D0|nr:tRNA (adenosine(37)-N6)-dimethylallyltransferase MiaA [Sphingomonas sp. EC-HK361]VVT11630.1 tRNA dimethylallyltransferase [Sphingomonas sp. EC-HK361]
MQTSRPPLALIAGPTASGKSAIALRLAEETGGVVINADSAQVYRDLRVVTARPSADEEARAEHRLYGYIDGAEACSAARWAIDAGAVIAETHAAGRLPILVGGTGLYIRTLLDGIAPVPEIDPAIRAEVRNLPVADAHRALANADPAAAARLAPADTTRVARALEVVRSTGQPLAVWQAQRAGGIGRDIMLSPVLLLPERTWLFDRIDRRAAVMLEDGAIDEVRRIAARALLADAPIRRAIGVPEIERLLNGTATHEETTSALALVTRQYAKRQYTWFRNQTPPDWRRLTEPPSNLKEYFRFGG